MPQLSPLFWMFSTTMVLFLLMSMMMVFYMHVISFNKVNDCSICLMNWCW
uniref:ATP synthase F0 subunit 8 n=1 Tax=Austrarchaea nodosa TaxID=1028198 RepID=H2E3X2_9ARAC|nr:ATP synthase F0 subunit 8 [Austrarchaea nodosa]AEX88884.1 ATP synthase F0 subunit 8 [Austrarchaea nodosa]AEX88890.1 ATP synthase F0 subunit 8 [Austrarchaea nodosa]